MITVKSGDTGISITGHAGYAEEGKDVVCAGISTIAMQLILSLESIGEPIKYSIDVGNVSIEYGSLSKSGKLLVDSFFIGCNFIKEQYPQYIRCELDTR